MSLIRCVHLFLSSVTFINLFVMVSAVSVCMLRVTTGCMSFSITFSHVIGGFPRFFFAGVRAYVNDFLAGVSFSMRMRCPNQFNLLRLIFLLHFSSFILLYSSSDVIFFGHRMFIACRSNLR